MSLNESILEDATLNWFRESDYPAGHRLKLAPGAAAAERDSLGEAVLVVCVREAIRPLSPAILSRTLAELRDTLLPKLLSGESTVAGANRLEHLR